VRVAPVTRARVGQLLHFQQEAEFFGARALPLAREIETAERDSVGEPVRPPA
jgi:FMNH2-dependent dimethyl sulfone monooxygenase